MSILADIIMDAVKNNKKINIEEDNGSQHLLTATGNTIKVITGEHNEYVMVENARSMIIYNLDKYRAILIS